MAVSNYMLLPPLPLVLYNPQAAEKWKKFLRAWNNYSLVTGLSDKSETVQVATLLTIIGKEAWDVDSTFTGWV